jgi:hypothetical protein
MAANELQVVQKSNMQLFEEGDETLDYLLQTSIKNAQIWREQYLKEKQDLQEAYDKFQKKWLTRSELLANVFEPDEK